jgi:hypothetical protein
LETVRKNYLHIFFTIKTRVLKDKEKESKMKDLSREEKLRQQLLEKADEYDDKKWMRVKRTFFVLTGAVYLIGLYISSNDGITIGTIFRLLLVSPLLAGVIMFIAYGVLFYLIYNGMQEEKDLATLKGRLYEIEFNKYDKCEKE